MAKLTAEWKEEILFRVRNALPVRFLCYPYMQMKRRFLKRRFAGTADAEYIRSFKQKHAGERCFIIGNGPSLTARDLQKLSGEKTFALNRIYYLYDRTAWRPTYYLCVDVGVIGMNLQAIGRMESSQAFLNITAKKHAPGNPNIHYILDYGRFRLNRFAYNPPYISEDVSDHFCSCFTVTFTAIQFAIYMGFREIYLLGVDHNYSVKSDTKGNFTRDPSVKDYFEGLSRTRITVMNHEATTAAFRAAREYCDAHGITIRNATRGGKLEVFERVDFDGLFP